MLNFNPTYCLQWDYCIKDYSVNTKLPFWFKDSFSFLVLNWTSHNCSKHVENPFKAPNSQHDSYLTTPPNIKIVNTFKIKQSPQSDHSRPKEPPAQNCWALVLPVVVSHEVENLVVSPKELPQLLCQSEIPDSKLKTISQRIVDDGFA